ncbi:MAG: repeat-containing protein YrrB [Verrucomicrobiota bacterium]|jgi:tetratricopeptide (TPR) repeat protein
MTTAVKPNPFSRGHALFAVALIFVALLAAYANSFGGPFVFDDVEAIVENPTIRNLAAPGAVLAPPFAEGQTVGGRPLVNVTLALNYAAGELNPVGYHVLNFAIHLAATLTLFGLIRRTLLFQRTDDGRPRTAPEISPLSPALCPPPAAVPFALVVALLWGLHPLQTEAVTYVIQRAESLMALCYLLTLYCFVRGVETVTRPLWLAASFACCLAGMSTKEVMVSAPVLVLLFDRAFVSGTIAAAWRQRRLYYGGLGATWLLLAALVLSTKDRGGSMGLGLNVSLGDYLLTQGPAILHYLRLVVWPHPLIFDYGAIFAEHALTALPAVGAVAALAVGTLWLLWKKPAAGFLAGWFFALLAPTSLVPANRQTLSEHRVYLALAPLFILGAAVVARGLGRLPEAKRRGALTAATVGCAVLALGFGGLTWRRNTVYQSDLALWSDTVAKRPENPHAYNNLGIALAALEKTEEARAQFAEAVRLDPQMASFHNNLGSALMTLEKPAEAAEHYALAVKLLPSFTGAWTNLGRALSDLDRLPEAIAAFDEALQRSPKNWDIRLARTFALLQGGRLDAAVLELAALVRERPEHAGARINLAMALSQLNRLPEAAAQYDAVFKLQPGDAPLHNAFGIVLAQLGRLAEARAQFAEAVRLDPGFTGARNNLQRADAMLR